MSDRVNLVRVFTASTGTATMTLGAAYSALFMTSAEAGMINGRTYTYLVTEGNDWELGKGVYTASGTTLSRVTVMASRIGGTLGTTKITLTGTAQVRIVESADDMGALRGTRAVTGTTDSLAQSDLGRAVTYSNAASIAVTIAQAGASSSFLDGWCVHVKNTGAGTLTITPTTSTINGGATLVLAQNLGAFIWSDGTNYHAYFFPVTKPLLAENNLSDVSAKYTAFDNLSVKGADVAITANNINLSTATGNLVDVTGTQTISSVTLSEGHERTVRFATGTAQINHGASLILPGSANITTVAGDMMVFRGYAAGVVRCVLYSPITVTGTGSAVKSVSPTLTTAELGSSTATTQSANDNSTKVATTAYADNVRDAPRVLSLSNGSASANLADIDYVVLPSTNSSSSTLSSFSNVVMGKLYIFYNTGGTDGLRDLTIDRNGAYLSGGVNSVMGITDVQLMMGRSTTTLAGAAPVSVNS